MISFHSINYLNLARFLFEKPWITFLVAVFYKMKQTRIPAVLHYAIALLIHALVYPARNAINPLVSPCTSIVLAAPHKTLQSHYSLDKSDVFTNNLHTLYHRLFTRKQTRHRFVIYIKECSRVHSSWAIKIFQENYLLLLLTCSS